MMTETQLYSLVVAVLNDGLKARGIADVEVRQADQPRKVGTPTAPAILLSNISGKRFGFLGEYDAYSATTQTIQHTERQVMERVLQCGALVPPAPPPAALPPYTAGDLVTIASTILQSSAGRSALRVGGVGIERVTHIRQPYFTDDRVQFEASPSFDFTVSFSNEETTPVPNVTPPVSAGVTLV